MGSKVEVCSNRRIIAPESFSFGSSVKGRTRKLAEANAPVVLNQVALNQSASRCSLPRANRPSGGKLLLDLAVNRGGRSVGVDLVCGSKRPLDPCRGQDSFQIRGDPADVLEHFSAPNDMRSEAQIIIHVMQFERSKN
jgi:hypothetical protein